MSKIRIYTDGACSVQERIGGYAFLVSTSKDQKVFSGGVKDTTNNRMELLAVIKGLIYASKISNEEVDNIEILSDSAYVVNAINKKWLESWKKRCFYTSEGKSVKNVDLWKQLCNIMKIIKEYGINIEFTKVKGHDGNAFNEMCDKAAKEEIKKIKESR